MSRFSTGLLVAFLATALLGMSPSFSQTSVYDRPGMYQLATYSDHDLVSQVRLGAAYLLKPDVADRTSVLWRYKIGDDLSALQHIGATRVYVRLHPDSDYIVIDARVGEGYLTPEQYQHYLRTVASIAKDHTFEFGVAGESQSVEGIKADGGIVRWEKDGVFAPDPELYALIVDLLRSDSVTQKDPDPASDGSADDLPVVGTEDHAE